MSQFVLAAFIMGVGLCMAAAGTCLYQGIAKKQAELQYYGETYWLTTGRLVMSFLCGPYIMLQLGWRHEPNGTLAVGSALLSALIAFGWSFITGLFFMSIYVAIVA